MLNTPQHPKLFNDGLMDKSMLQRRDIDTDEDRLVQAPLQKSSKWRLSCLRVLLKPRICAAQLLLEANQVVCSVLPATCAA